MDRQQLSGSIGAALVTAGLVVLGSKTLGLSETVRTVVLALVFIVGAWLLVAAFMGWPPAGRPLSPAHGAQLREIARRIGTPDPYHSDEERAMFRAHYPSIAKAQQDRDNAERAEKAAWERLNSEARTGVIEAFLPAEAWANEGIYANTVHLLRDKTEPTTLADGEIEKAKLKTGGADDPPYLVWRSHVIWERPGTPASEHDLTAKADEVRSWFVGLVASDAADAYRRAIVSRRTAEDILDSERQPVLHHVAIRYSRKCPICRPQKKRR